jgi:hypothetical protein
MERMKLAADLDFTPEAIIVAFDQPTSWPPFRWKWWPGRLRWSGYRHVRRGFVLRARTLRELITDQLTFDALAARYPGDVAGYLTARCLIITGSTAIPYVPAKVLEEIDALYRRINSLPTSADLASPKATSVPFDVVLRRLERDPFHYTRDEILAMTCAQISARLAEWGTERLNDEQRHNEMGGAA